MSERKNTENEKNDAVKIEADANIEKKNSTETEAPKPAQPIRSINEDDDGYDPYSDLHDQGRPEPLFERDPWR